MVQHLERLSDEPPGEVQELATARRQHAGHGLNLRTLEAVAAAATERRYTITLMPLARPTHAEVSIALDRLGEQAVDGVILLIESHLAGQAGTRLHRGVPVFAANDRMALGVLRALMEAQRRVPEDVSVAGFDDMPEARNFIPPLTTVHQDFTAIGRTAVHALVQEIEGGPPAEYKEIAPG